MNAAPPLEPWLLDQLRNVGLENPSPTDPLHVRLVNTLHRLGPGQTSGSYLVALRFDFNWFLQDAGREFAQAKTDYEHHVDRAAVKARAEGEKSGEMAVRMANATDEAYTLLLKYRLAEQRERSMRKFLDTIGSAMDNWRTSRADERAADRSHADGYSGGA